MRFKIFAYLFFPFILFASAVPDFDDFSKSKDVVFFLSTPRSGTNWISASLVAITRKPVSWVSWGKRVFEPLSKFSDHPSYNRLKLDLVGKKPLMYRTHYDFAELMEVPSYCNQLIFVTRNPKELLFRYHALKCPTEVIPSAEFIQNFFDNYLKAFQIYNEWNETNRKLIFYEDFIDCGDEILLDLLKFIGEPATFWDDFLLNREEYMVRLLESYEEQHKKNAGGASSKGGAKAIFYIKDVDPQLLQSIDEYLQKSAPEIWEKYLKRFAI